MSPKTAILLVNLGGPDSLSAVKPFLYNLFSDPDIIRLPWSWLLQKPIAWSISTWRSPEVRELYHLLGGRSPILPLTQNQADALQDSLDKDNISASVYIAMRYWYPFTEAVVDEMQRDGIEQIVVLPLYPQFSLTTTGSSVNELNRVLREKGVSMDVSVIAPYYLYPTYQAALKQTIEEGLANNEWSCPPEEVQVLFSAHSLPKKFVKKTGDVYPQQTLETAQHVMANFENPWELAYQSKVGSMPWLGPATDGVLHYFAAEHVDNVLMVPLSFVSDHLETLYEMDMLYKGLAEELGITHCHRAKALNNNPLFIQCLSELVANALKVDRVPTFS